MNGKIRTKAEKQEIERIVYDSDASGIKGNAVEIKIPEKIEEVESIIRSSVDIDIVPRGGGSGLVGGAVPQNSIVIDLSKLNRIIEINNEKKTAYVEAGVILDELNEALREYGLEFPVNPSSHAVCTIGGMIATNAVGSRAIKYGRTSEWNQSLDIVDGFGNLKRVNKIDLMDVAGLEGTTGIIVRALLKLTEIKKRTADLVEANSIDEVMQALDKMKREQEVSMIEIFDRQTSKLLGFTEKYHLFIEYESDRGNLKNRTYNEVMKKRDSSYPVLAEKGYTIIEDPKILQAKLPEFLAYLEEKEIPFFGHLSVGIIHPCFKKQQEKLVDEMMVVVKKLHGEITGEHGIGLLKKKYIEEQDKKIPQILKKRYDPANKLNRGKML